MRIGQSYKINLKKNDCNYCKMVLFSLPLFMFTNPCLVGAMLMFLLFNYCVLLERLLRKKECYMYFIQASTR